jgi:hypothetical protein
MAVCEKFTAFQLIERAMAVIPIERDAWRRACRKKGLLEKQNTARLAQSDFTVVFYGLKILYCKTAQF